MDATFFRPRNCQQALLPSDEPSRSNAENDCAHRYKNTSCTRRHCTTEKRNDTRIGWQLSRRNAGEIARFAADNGYDWQRLREKLREEGVRPLIKHRKFQPTDCAHSACTDGSLYGQRKPSETVFSTIKRKLGHAVRARAWYREFRDIALMCAVYNIKRAVKP